MPRPLASTRRARAVRRVTAALVALAVLVPVAASALPVDPYASYDPQSTCSPTPKPGTVRLSVWLQQEYPGSGSLGISRSCNDGGVSEHKEGRAFDWAVNATSARDRGYVTAFFAKIFATDADGNPHALARRMGIMYLIWDDHIYSSYYGFSSRAYYGCKVLATCSATLRHRNHVHISLSRAGGAGTTTWYTGDPTVPDPVVSTPPPTSPATPDTPDTPDPGAPAPVTSGPAFLDLDTEPVTRLSVSARGGTIITAFQVHRGTAYKVTVVGQYRYGARSSQRADASCRWSRAAHRWLPRTTRAISRGHGSLNLLVDGLPVSGPTCHPRSHVYTRVIRPVRDRPGDRRQRRAARLTGPQTTDLMFRTNTDPSRQATVATR